MTDWNKQGPAYKKLAQEQAETIRWLREELNSVRHVKRNTEFGRQEWWYIENGKRVFPHTKLPEPTIPNELPRRIWDME